MQADWDPGQYERFAAERAQPFWDLAALVEAAAAPGSIRRAHDLGCGTGELTAQLAARLGVGDMIGSDTSPAMLGARPPARGPGPALRGAGPRRLDERRRPRPRVRQRQPAVGARPPGRARPLVGGVAPGGHLAVQVPANADHASHRVAAEVAATEPFRTAMGGSPPSDRVAVNVLAPEQYAMLLDHLGADASTCACRSTATFSPRRATWSSGSRARR